MLVHQRISRYWKPYLTTSQLDVVFFIFDRTYGWGKESEIITHKQFLEGVLYEDKQTGELRVAAAPLAMKDRALTYCLTALGRLGMIQAERLNDGSRRLRYTLNIHWTPADNPNAFPAMPLAKPKRLENCKPCKSAPESEGQAGEATASECGTYRTPMRDLPQPGAVYKKEKGKREKGKKEIPSESRTSGASPGEGDASGEAESLRPAPCPSTPATAGHRPDCHALDSRLAAAASRNATRRDANLHRWTFPAANAFWESTVAACHGDSVECLTETQAFHHAFHRYGRRWMKAHKRPITDFIDYVRWSIDRWGLIRATQLDFIKGEANAPNRAIFVKLGYKFEAAYAERERLESRAMMTTAEAEVARLVHRGMDRATAEAQVAEKDAITQERKRLEQAKREAVDASIRLANSRARHGAGNPAVEAAREERRRMRKAEKEFAAKYPGGQFGDFDGRDLQAAPADDLELPPTTHADWL